MNKRKNGFTLTEVLVVTIILSFITTLVLVNFSKTLAITGSRAYQDKISIILEAAKLYGSDNSQVFNVNDSIEITIGKLIENDYIKPDVTSGDDNCNSSYGCIINPDTNESLNDEFVKIIKNGAIYEAYIEQ